MLIRAPAQILFATQPIDFRNSIDGLAAVVSVQLGEEALSGALFVFTNRRRTGLKLLIWDHGGFVMLYKKLERGRFCPPPVDATQDRLRLTPAELAALLEGIDLSRATRLKRWNPR